VLSVDYVRHHGVHYLLRREANRRGAADTLDVTKALTAMAKTNASFGCPGTTSAQIDCALAHGATIEAYANRGLGKLATASASAFPGLSPDFNNVTIDGMDGVSSYNALQVQLRGRLPNLRGWMKDTTVVASYSLSRLEASVDDQGAVFVSADNLKPLYGPATIDRTHIFSMGTSFAVPSGIRISSYWRGASALPQSVFVPEVRKTAAEIFYTEFDGDGTAADALPGTKRGSYGRDIGCGAAALNRVIDAYNSTQAGNLTPAGQALVSAGLFTPAQLKALGAVSPTVLPWS